MPHITRQILPIGPIIEILIGVSKPRHDALVSAKMQVPAPVPVRALIDTGATCTAIDPSIVAVLQLSPTGSTQVHTPSTGDVPCSCEQFDIRLGLVASGLSMNIEPLPVIQSLLKPQGIEALLGRDILARCVLVYNGASAIFSLSF